MRRCSRIRRASPPQDARPQPARSQRHFGFRQVDDVHSRSGRGQRRLAVAGRAGERADRTCSCCHRRMCGFSGTPTRTTTPCSTTESSRLSLRCAARSRFRGRSGSGTAGRRPRAARAGDCRPAGRRGWNGSDRQSGDDHVRHAHQRWRAVRSLIETAMSLGEYFISRAGRRSFTATGA